jgi:hypothetical protein
MNEVTRDKKIILCIGTHNPNIGVGNELQNIESTMRGSSGFDVETQYVSRNSELFHLITRYSPQIIHISGEGLQNGALKIPDLDNNENAQQLKPDVLAEYFAANKDINCVFLNFCYSKAAAELIARHIKYVIGVDGPIEDTATIEFSRGFYEYLNGKPLDHNSLEQAFIRGNSVAFDRSGNLNKYVKFTTQPEMQLIEPIEGSNVPRNCKFSGNFSNLPEGATMWAYVYATLERKFYLVPIEDYSNSSRTWQKEVIVGTETDTSTYRVGVLVADTEVTKTLNDDFSKLDILRFDSLPNGTTKFGDRVVKRQ